MHINKIKNNIGATAIEYALLAFLIAVGLTTSMISISGSLSNTFCAVSFGLSKTSCANSGSGSGTSSSGSGSSSGSSSSSGSPEDNETGAFDDLSNALEPLFNNVTTNVNAYIAAQKATQAIVDQIHSNNDAKTAAYNTAMSCYSSGSSSCTSEQDAYNDLVNKAQTLATDFNNANAVENQAYATIQTGLDSDLNSFGGSLDTAKSQYGQDVATDAANNVLKQTLTDTATGNSFALNTMYNTDTSNNYANYGATESGVESFMNDLQSAYPKHTGDPDN